LGPALWSYLLTLICLNASANNTKLVVFKCFQCLSISLLVERVRRVQTKKCLVKSGRFNKRVLPQYYKQTIAHRCPTKATYKPLFTTKTP
jgi:hypothetical protein